MEDCGDRRCHDRREGSSASASRLEVHHEEQLGRHCMVVRGRGRRFERGAVAGPDPSAQLTKEGWWAGDPGGGGGG
jgi:hypothetical protein